MISQLKNIQTLVIFVLEFFYSLELRLAGFNNKGITIQFGTSTVSDDIKLQQAREYRARVNITLYNQGIISQDQFARDMGYENPDLPEPRTPVDSDDSSGTGDTDTGKKKRIEKTIKKGQIVRAGTKITQTQEEVIKIVNRDKLCHLLKTKHRCNGVKCSS